MRQKNLIRYTCDRCGKSQIFNDGDPTGTWQDMRRIDAAGQEVSRLLCGDCFKGWKQLQQRHDIEYSQFMTTASEEVAA